jgi:general secretion pathway protein D
VRRSVVLSASPVVFCAAFVLALAGTPSPADAQARDGQPRALSARASADPSRDVRVQYKGVALPRVIREIGEATGTRFIFGDEVRGIVTITVPKPVSRDEALELLRAALFIKGYAEVPAGGDAYKIVPIAMTPTDAEFVDRDLAAGSERAITTMVSLDHISAEEIAETIKPLAPSSGAVVAYVPSNSIFLSGTEAAIGRLISVVRLLDEAAAEQLWARVIRYRDVDQLIEIADAALNEGWSAGNKIELFSDSRTNMLIARATKERLDALRDFVEKFDRLEAGAGGIHVVRILNRDPNEVVEIIQTLQAGGARGRGDEPPDVPVDDEEEGDDGGPLDDEGPLDDDGGDVLEGLPTSETARSLEGLQFTLTADEASRSVIVQAARIEAQIVADMIAELDRIPPRVAIELLYYEIQRPSGYLLSFDVIASATPGDGNAAVRIQSTPAGGAAAPNGPAEGGAFAKVGSRPATVSITNPLTGETQQLLLPTNEARVGASATGTVAVLLSRPTLTVTSGEEHELFVGNNVPIPISTSGSTSVTNEDGTSTPAPINPLIQQQRIERQDVGVSMRLRPTVGEEGNVKLDLTFELSEVIPSAPLVGATSRQVGVSLVQRRLESTSVLRPGQYLMLGMAEERSVVKSRSGIPWLMDIPGLGLLFSRVEERVVDTRLMIVARARRLRSPADDIAESVRRRIAFERSISRVNRLERLPERPWAVRLATFEYRDSARTVADRFEDDGYVTRVTRWEAADRRPYWDVYLIGYPDYETASAVALQAAEADWDADVLLVPAINELAPEE